MVPRSCLGLLPKRQWTSYWIKVECERQSTEVSTKFFQCSAAALKPNRSRPKNSVLMHSHLEKGRPMMKLNYPTTPFATAFNMPINDAIERVIASARELDAAAEKTSRGQDFGSRLAQAVRRKQSSIVFAAAPSKDDDDEKDKDADNESFGKKLKKAIKRKQRPGPKRG